MTKTNLNRSVTRNGYKHIVSLSNNGFLLCDCKDDVFHGVPCRHQLAIALKTKNFDFKILRFVSRWKKNFYKEPEHMKEPESLPKMQINRVIFVITFLTSKKIRKIVNPQTVNPRGRPVTKNQRNKSITETITTSTNRNSRSKSAIKNNRNVLTRSQTIITVEKRQSTRNLIPPRNQRVKVRRNPF